MKMTKGTKIIALTMGLLVVLTLSVVGTFAWFTMSHDASLSTINVKVESVGDEIPIQVSLDGTNWTNELHYEDFIRSAQVTLRPISTYDLVHWYLPIYDMDGNISYFYSKDTLTSEEDGNGNATYIDGRLMEIGKYINDGAVEQNAVEDDGTSYVAYFDLYMRTTDPTGKTFSVRLNNPSKNDDGTYNVEDYENVHGTYVLPLPRHGTDTNLGYDNLLDGGALAARIGFMVYDIDSLEETASTKTNLMIFEPNANARNEEFQAISNSSETDVKYIKGLGADEANRIKQYSTSYHQGELYATYVPEYDESVGIKYKLHAQDTVKQTLSVWNEAAINELSYDSDGLPVGLNSRAVQTFGELLEETDSSGTDTLTFHNSDASYHNGASEVFYKTTDDFAELTTVTCGELKKIRVFIWIEGQDPDCWNQIAGDGIIVNLEFRGDVME